LVAENEANLYSLSMDISLKNLEEAVSIRRQIDILEKRLASILGTVSPHSASKASPRKMSPQARAKIAAAMRARWAKRKGATADKSTPKKGGLTPAGRKRLSQLMKARWAAKKRADGRK
jgi:hypothetical protein